jgi:hypothetical protein
MLYFQALGTKFLSKKNSSNRFDLPCIFLHIVHCSIMFILIVNCPFSVNPDSYAFDRTFHLLRKKNRMNDKFFSSSSWWISNSTWAYYDNNGIFILFLYSIIFEHDELCRITSDLKFIIHAFKLINTTNDTSNAHLTIRLPFSERIPSHWYKEQNNPVDDW